MKLIKIVLFSAVMIFGSMQSSFACICEPTLPPPCYSYWQYDAVFVGTVTEIKSDDNLFLRKIRVAVDKNYKGVNSDVVYTQRGGTSCDFEGYNENEKFLI